MFGPSIKVQCTWRETLFWVGKSEDVVVAKNDPRASPQLLRLRNESTVHKRLTVWIWNDADGTWEGKLNVKMTNKKVNLEMNPRPLVCKGIIVPPCPYHTCTRILAKAAKQGDVHRPMLLPWYMMADANCSGEMPLNFPVAVIPPYFFFGLARTLWTQVYRSHFV